MHAANLLFPVLALFACATAASREGELDPSFNGNGELAFSINAAQAGVDQAYAIAIQPDGRIVVAGSSYAIEPPQSKWAVARVNPDGSLDAGFGTGGRIAPLFGSATTSATATVVAIQDDGKIVVGGYYDLNLAIARFNTDGTLDNSFAAGGVYLANPSGGSTQAFISDLALGPQPAGGQLMVFVGGSATGAGPGAFLRGFIDSTGQFPHIDSLTGPADSSSFNALARQGNTFVMVGKSSSLSPPYKGYCSTRRYRLGYSSFGLLQFFTDPSFVPSDFVLGTSASADCHLDSVAVLPDGNLVLGGHQNQDTAVSPFAYGLNGNDGSANGLVVGNAFAAVFGTDQHVLAQGDGKIVLVGTTAGDTDNRMLVQRRLWQSGSQNPDPSYADGGTATIDFDHAGINATSVGNAAAIDRYGRVIVVGTTEDVGTTTTRIAIARLQGDLIFSDGFESP